MEALKISIHKLNNGKAVGYDGLKAEMIKYMSPTGRKLLFKNINLGWNTSEIPRDWPVAVIRPIFKKRDHRKCRNYIET